MREHRRAGHRQRLRERFLKGGASAGFHDYELLELLLSYAIPRRDTKRLAKALLEEFGSLESVISQPPEILQKVEGIGQAASVLLNLISMIARKERPPRKGEHILLDRLEGVKAYLSDELRFVRRERLIALLLDGRNRLIAEKLIDSGSVDRSAVHPRNLVEKIIQTGATGVILVHNHPGGRPEASREDLELTRKLRELGRSLGFRILDHLIVSPEGVLSMREESLI